MRGRDAVDVGGTPQWRQIAERVTVGECVPLVADGRCVAEVVPIDELERLRETIAVLADREAVAALADDSDEGSVTGVEAARALVESRRVTG